MNCICEHEIDCHDIHANLDVDDMPCSRCDCDCFVEEPKRCERCGIPRDNNHPSLCPICRFKELRDAMLDTLRKIGVLDE